MNLNAFHANILLTFDRPRYYFMCLALCFEIAIINLLANSKGHISDWTEQLHPMILAL